MHEFQKGIITSSSSFSWLAWLIFKNIVNYNPRDGWFFQYIIFEYKILFNDKIYETTQIKSTHEESCFDNYIDV